MTDKIRVLIIDDEPLARRGIRRLLEADHEFVIVGEAANGRQATTAIETLNPDLVFLDIQMPVLDGLSVVESIKVDRVPEFVFVTAFDEYAVRAFEAGAIDYVLKPINPERFEKTLERVRPRIHKNKDGALGRLEQLINTLKNKEGQYIERIAVRDGERFQFLTVDEISWISSSGNYIEIHSGNGKYLLRETMEGIERKLDPRRFLRIRRSAIVRFDEIKEVQRLFGGEYSVVMTDGTELRTSRHYRGNLESLIKI